MRQLDCLESAICQELFCAGSFTLDELYKRLPFYPWTRVVPTVDRLTREGMVAIQRQGLSHYVLTLASPPRAEADHVMQV